MKKISRILGLIMLIFVVPLGTREISNHVERSSNTMIRILKLIGLSLAILSGTAFALSAQDAPQQPQRTATFSGVIVDMNGETIPGVAVFTKDNGTISDENGAWTLTAKEGEDISFSFLGYQTVTVSELIKYRTGKPPQPGKVYKKVK